MYHKVLYEKTITGLRLYTALRKRSRAVEGVEPSLAKAVVVSRSVGKATERFGKRDQRLRGRWSRSPTRINRTTIMFDTTTMFKTYCYTL